MTLDEIFSEEEMSAAIAIKQTPAMFVDAMRHSTNAWAEFGRVVMLPIVRTLLGPLSPLEIAISTCFYRIMGCLDTMVVLQDPRFFQALSGTARTTIELCMDVHLLCGPKALDRAAERFHGFTDAARFQAAWKTVDFSRKHHHLDEPAILAARREYTEKAGKLAEYESLCMDLWGTTVAPKHWSKMSWDAIADHLGEGFPERRVEWFTLFAWHVHGGAAGVGGINETGFAGMEVLSREQVAEVLPEAFRLIAVALHLHRAETFFEDLQFVRDSVLVAALTDAKLMSVGRPSRLEALRRFRGLQ